MSASDELLDKIYSGQIIVVMLIGLIMNLIVIWRMRILYSKNREQYFNGAGICLFIMSVADIISMSALFLEFFSNNILVIFNETLQNMTCKTLAFLSHTAFTQSFYSLVIMSFLRFVAKNRPLEYKILYRIPFIAISVTFVLAVLLNSYLFFGVKHQDGECIQPMSTISRIYKFADFFLSFCFPVLIVLYFDLDVICFRIKPSNDPMLQIVINRPNCEKRKPIKRFLIILFLVIILNFPEHFLRISEAFDISIMANISPPFLILAKAMFFSQFAFKSFYLTIVVYDKSVLSKTNSSRQLSNSFRQRLEESSQNQMIHIRSRASTMSYRASTPIPIQRNKSSPDIEHMLMPMKYSF